METRSMKKNHITPQDKEVAIILKDLHKEPPNELCQLNDEGILQRKQNISNEILLERLNNELQQLKLIKAFKENLITIQEMIITAKDPLTIQILNEENIRIEELINRIIKEIKYH